MHAAQPSIRVSRCMPPTVCGDASPFLPAPSSSAASRLLHSRRPRPVTFAEHGAKRGVHEAVMVRQPWTENHEHRSPRINANYRCCKQLWRRGPLSFIRWATRGDEMHYASHRLAIRPNDIEITEVW